MSDTEREAFEAWAEPAGYELHLMNSGSYLSVYTRDAWIGWQARGRRTTTTEARAPLPFQYVIDETIPPDEIHFIDAAGQRHILRNALAAGAPATPSPPSLGDPIECHVCGRVWTGPGADGGPHGPGICDPIEAPSSALQRPAAGGKA